MVDQISQYQAAPFNGPFSQNALLLDSIGANNAEGLWIDTRYLKSGNVELSGTFSTVSMQLYGTNLDSVGTVNQQTITIGGSITTNDVVTATFTNPNLAAGSEAVAYTVKNTDTTTTIATALAAAINADAKLQAIGITATSAAAVVTVSYPSVAASAENTEPSQPGPSNYTTITGSVSGSATETFTQATTTTGTTIGSAITAKGFTALAEIPRYIKARITTLTGSSPSVNAALQGAG